MQDARESDSQPSGVETTVDEDSNREGATGGRDVVAVPGAGMASGDRDLRPHAAEGRTVQGVHGAQDDAPQGRPAGGGARGARAGQGAGEGMTQTGARWPVQHWGSESRSDSASSGHELRTNTAPTRG